MSKNSKIVLMVTTYFYPWNSIGTIRMCRFAKYLVKYGWRLVVLTPEEKYIRPEERDYEGLLEKELLQEIEIIRTDIWWKKAYRQSSKVANAGKSKYPLSKRICNKFQRWTLFPDEWFGWIFSIDKYMRDIVNQNISVIFSSLNPATCHFVARKIRKHLGDDIPWITDFRDLWADDYYSRFSLPKALLAKFYEKKILAEADCVTTVSNSWRDKLQDNTVSPHKVVTIMNGLEYYPDVVNPSSTKFTITYTGSLYSGHRDPTPLFAALQLLAKRNQVKLEDFEIHYYGIISTPLINAASEYNLQNLVIDHGFVSQQETHIAQQKSTILLLLVSNHPLQSGVITGKVFEYLAAQRPILMFGPIGELSELLSYTRAGKFFTLDEVEKIAETIYEWYQEFKRTGTVQCQGDNERISEYTSENQTLKLIQLFNMLLGKS